VIREFGSMTWDELRALCKLLLGFWPTGICIDEKRELVTFVNSVFGSRTVDYWWLDDHLCEIRPV